MMRVQFVKAPPAAVERGEWLAVEIRIVNESNGSVKVTGKIAVSLSLIGHNGSCLEGASILDATSESPALFTPEGKKQSNKFSAPSSGCLKLWFRVSSHCNGLHYMGKAHTDKCMHRITHPLRLKFDACAAAGEVLPLYSGAFSVIGPDTNPEERQTSAVEGSSLELCSEAGASWSSCSDGAAPGWRCIVFQGSSLFFQESPSYARECTGAVVWDGALMLLDLFAPMARSFGGKHVLDLGCGTGIVGIALASIGARVWLTDIGVGVDIARCNAVANAKAISDRSGRATAQQLDWTTSQPVLAAFPTGGTVDFIIACEVVYNNEAFAPLLQVLTMMSCRATFIYLVLRQRHGCDTAAFVRDARSSFAVEELSLPPAWREKAGGGDAKAQLDQNAGLKHSLKLYTLRRLK